MPLDTRPVGDTDLVFTRRFAAPRDTVFDAFHTPATIQKWMLGPSDDFSMPVCEIEPEPGTAIRYVWRKPDGTDMGMRGTMQEFDRPNRSVHTELFDEDWTQGETIVTNEFTAVSDAETEVVLTIRYPTREVRDMVQAMGMGAAVEAGYVRLDRILANSD